jgi:uncharacterized membrane protein YhdT
MTRLPIACFIFARHFLTARDAAWSRYSLFSGLAMLVVFVIYAAGAGGADGLEPITGWLERASIVVGFAWIALLAVRVLQRS